MAEFRIEQTCARSAIVGRARLESSNGVFKSLILITARRANSKPAGRFRAPANQPGPESHGSVGCDYSCGRCAPARRIPPRRPRRPQLRLQPTTQAPTLPTPRLRSLRNQNLRLSKRPPNPRQVRAVDPVTEAQKYIYGKGGVRQDCDRGLRILKPAADHANPKAMIEMGALYSRGIMHAARSSDGLSLVRPRITKRSRQPIGADRFTEIVGRNDPTRAPTGHQVEPIAQVYVKSGAGFPSFFRVLCERVVILTSKSNALVRLPKRCQDGWLSQSIKAFKHVSLTRKRQETFVES